MEHKDIITIGAVVLIVAVFGAILGQAWISLMFAL